jgi:[ribosomal protein S5]-alanine N-acetyltransferase
MTLAELEWLIEGNATFASKTGCKVAEGWEDDRSVLPMFRDFEAPVVGSPWGASLFIIDSTLVGFGGWKGRPTDGTAELGYSVSPLFQRRGIATTAVAILLRQAQEEGVHCAIAHTLREGVASQGVLRRNDFIMVAQVESNEGTFLRWERILT